MNEQNKILYDWVSFTSKIHSPQQIIEMLGMGDCTWQTIKGAQGYKDRYYYDNVSVHYNGREDMGVWCELSGQGCRNFETHGHGDYDLIFGTIESNPKDMNLTRLDVAYDDFKGLLDLDILLHETLAGNYVRRARRGECVIGNGDGAGTTIIHGSKSSDFLIRIYDKKAERNREDVEHWVRCEIQMRRENAFNFSKIPELLDKKYFDVLNNYLRYIVPSGVINRSEVFTAPHWLKFLESFDSTSIFQKPGTDYNVLNLENYVINQNGGAIKTYVKLFGLEDFMKNLNDRKAPLNPKYKTLLSENDIPLSSNPISDFLAERGLS